MDRTVIKLNSSAVALLPSAARTSPWGRRIIIRRRRRDANVLLSPAAGYKPVFDTVHA